MKAKQAKIEYIPYMNNFRVCDAGKPEITFAYADTFGEAVTLAEENGYEPIFEKLFKNKEREE